MKELARLVYSAPEGEVPPADARRAALHEYLSAIDAVLSAANQIRARGLAVSLRLASTGESQNLLKDLLEPLGFELGDRGEGGARVYQAHEDASPRAARRRELARLAGLDLDGLIARLNGGEDVEVEYPSEEVPLPLPAAVWRERLLAERVPSNRLFTAIARDRQLTLLLVGLGEMGPATVAYLPLGGEDPFLRRMLHEHAGNLAAFGRAFRVRDGKVDLPGGSDASPLWAALVDEPLADPARFLRRLMSRDEGRLAYFYYALSHLDEPRRRFALGLPSGEARVTEAGVDRFRSLYGAFRDSLVPWTSNLRPFNRPSHDAAQLLGQVSVTVEGRLAGPAWPGLWRRVFDGDSVPHEEAVQELSEQIKNEGGALDAAALIERICTQDLQFSRADRLSAFLFAQRVFGGAPLSEAGDVLAAVRGVLVFRTLALVLERIGVTAPVGFVRLARVASVLSRIGDVERASVALAQFQSALAMIDRIRFAGTISAEVAVRLVESLADTPVSAGGRWDGRLAAWYGAHVLPALRTAVGASESVDADELLVRAMAGDRVRPPASVLPRVEWEGQTYDVDWVEAELERLGEIREAQVRTTLASALALSSLAQAFQVAPKTLDALTSLLAELDGLKAARIPEPVLGRLDPHESGEVSRIIDDTLRNVAKIRRPKDLERVPRVTSRLVALSDAVLADAMITYAYLPHLGEARRQAARSGPVALRHEFALKGDTDAARLRSPWAIPEEQTVGNGGWFMRGSILGLDVGLARLVLRRVAEETLPPPPTMSQNDRQSLTLAVSLMVASTLTDDDRDAIAAGLAEGRRRLARLVEEDGQPGESASAWPLNEARVRALRWVAAHEPERIEDVVSVAEVFWLASGPEPRLAYPDAWGASLLAAESCVCLRFRPPPTELFDGRPSIGFSVGRLLDLQLAVAESLAEHALPALLTPGVMAAAVQDVIDLGNPIHEDDWRSVVAQARRLVRERFADYVASLTADGPLRPVLELGESQP